MKDSNVLVLTQVHIDIFMVMMLLLGIYWGFLEGIFGSNIIVNQLLYSF
jgi:hypothetical protein